MLNDSRKTKYIGFRVAYEQYIQTIQAAENAGVSITDYILSKLSLSKPTFKSSAMDNETVQIVKRNENNLATKYLKESQEKLNQLNLKKRT